MLGSKRAWLTFSILLHPLPACCSWLWHAYQRPAWTPDSHQQFQPAFRAAARTLLLAAHRSGKQAGRSATTGLGAMPQDVLLHIISTAAYPTCAWL